MGQGVGKGGRVYNKPEAADRALTASAARTASANGTAFDTEDAVAITGTLVVTAHQGTAPTLDVKLQENVDGTNWNDVGAFPQVGNTNLTGWSKTFGPLTAGSQCRWVWAIGGSATPGYTFRIDTVARRGFA